MSKVDGPIQGITPYLCLTHTFLMGCHVVISPCNMQTSAAVHHPPIHKLACDLNASGKLFIRGNLHIYIYTINPQQTFGNYVLSIPQLARAKYIWALVQ